MGLGMGLGIGLGGSRNWTPPLKSDALLWLDGTILDVTGTKYFVDKISGKNFLITGYDFDSTWLKGFPYKSAATISAPAGDATLIAEDINNYLYDSGGTPNAIPVVSLFQDVDYEHKLFCRHIAQIVDGNGVETYEPRVSDIVLYNTVKSGADLTVCQLSFSVPAEVSSNVIYVSKTGNDTTGNGSKATPYLTLMKAESVSSGKTIYVKSGTYVENHYMPNANTWIAVGLTRLQANTNNYALWTAGNKVLSLNGFIVDGTTKQNCLRLFATSNNKTFNRCYFVNSTTYSITNEGNVNDVQQIFNNCVIKSTSTNFLFTNGGFKLNGCFANYVKAGGDGISTTSTATGQADILYCKFTGNCRYFISFLAVDKFVINFNYNTSISTTVTGLFVTVSQKNITVKFNKLDCSGTPISVTPYKDFPILISGNTLSNRLSSGYLVMVGNETTSAYDDICTSITINKNKCFGALYYDSSDTMVNKIILHGIIVGHQKNAIISHNRVFGCRIGIIKKHTLAADTLGGIFNNLLINNIESIYIKGQDDVKIYGNTCYNDLMTSANQGFKAVRIGANGGTNYSTGCVLKNNIFINTLANKSICALIYGDEVQSTFISNYNILYSIDRKVRINTTDYLTLADWQVSTQDLNSIDSDPLLTNLIPSLNSPAIGNGETLDAAYDDGLDASTNWGTDTQLPVVVTKQQGAAWDIGAYVH